MVNRIRDVKMVRYNPSNQPDLILALEAQREIHLGMPVRVMTYDALDYSEQIHQLDRKHRKNGTLKSSMEFLSGMKTNERLLPVLTTVFYYGNNEWTKPLCLNEVTCLPKDVQPWKDKFADYKINLATCENVDSDNFQTGLKDVFELLNVAKNKNELRKFLAANRTYYSSLSKEKMDLVSVFLDIPTMRENPEKYINEIGGGYNMCIAIEEMVQEGRQEGRQVGIQEGRQEGELWGEKRYNLLVKKLLKDRRLGELEKIVNDEDYRKRMYEEYNL